VCRLALALLLLAEQGSGLAPPGRLPARPAHRALQGPCGRHLGLRGGCDGGASPRAESTAAQPAHPLSLWTSLFALAFASTLVTAQLATRDLIPGRAVLRYQVVGKHRLPDPSRGCNASVLQIVVSTSPTAPPSKAPRGGQEQEEDTATFDVQEMNRGLTLPTEFDLEEGDHMLWYRLCSCWLPHMLCARMHA
jgi:hypothetical protein